MTLSERGTENFKITNNLEMLDMLDDLWKSVDGVSDTLNIHSIEVVNNTKIKVEPSTVAPDTYIQIHNSRSEDLERTSQD